MIFSEIRTPLNNLLGICQLATEENNPARKNDYLSAMLSNASYINKLFDDIQEIHNIETGKIPVSISKTDINKVLLKVNENINKTIKNEKNNKIEIRNPVYSNDTKDIIYSDEAKITQVFTLITGILFQTKRNGIISFGFKGRNSKNEFTFFIGYEIDNTIQPFQNISHPVHFLFEKSDIIIDINYRLCKLIVEYLGGSYSIHNDYYFQEFTFTLPSSKTTINTSLLTTGKFIFKGQQVLIFTNDEEINKYFSENFKGTKLSFCFVKDGIRLIDLARQKKFDAIIIDISDNDIDGLETIWTLRHKGIHTPVLSVFAHEDSALKDKSIKLGSSDYFTKPLNNSIILHKLHRIFKTKNK